MKSWHTSADEGMHNHDETVTLPEDDDNVASGQQQFLTPDNEDEPRYLSIHSALDVIGYGAFQRRILVAAGLCSAADAMEILILTFLSSWVAQEWDLSQAQRSSLISCVFAG